MAAPQVIVMTGKFTKLDGTPDEGTIEFIAPDSIKSAVNDEVITPGRVTATLVAGVMSQPIYSTTDPNWAPNPWAYKVIAKLTSYRDTFDLIVPYDAINATLDYADVAPAVPPSTLVAYAPLVHTHPEYEGGAGGAVSSVNGRTGAVTLTKSDVSLANVDNTSDASKPVSTAQQTALNLKANLASPTFTGTVSGITKSMVGLGNADNTSDASKPVSTAQQTALNLKADLVGGVVPTAQIPAIALVEYLGTAANQTAMLAMTGQPGDWANRTDLGTTWQITGSDPTQLSNWTQVLYPASPVQSVNGQTGVVSLAKADVGLGNVDNTADSAKPVSAAQQTALDVKPNVYLWNGSAYALVSTGDFYVGPSANDPGAVGDGSVWIKTT